MPPARPPAKIDNARQPRRARVREARAEYAAAPTLGVQLPLFGDGPPAANGQAAFRDPAFGDNKNLPVHRWVPWIAGYSASFVDDVIAAYLPPRRPGLVLDPFCGVGTTLLQAVLRGHGALGFEINPYPTLAARAKLGALDVDLAALDAAIGRMQREAGRWRGAPPPAGIAPPPLKSRLPFFSPPVEQQVLHALQFVAGLESQEIANLFRAAFGAVMVSFSNYSYEPSLGSRPAAGKPLIEDADVGKVLLGKLHQMRADTAWLQEEMAGRRRGASRVVNGDFFEKHREEPAGSVDLLITSPPYMNNYHYVRNTRPQLYWLDFISSPGQQQPLETGNFGQYWQTVREAEPIALTFEHRPLQSLLRGLHETRPDKGAYGGPGWANYVTKYFNDCDRFAAAVKRLLRRGGVGVVVIGNSIIQGHPIETQDVLGDICRMRGLALEGVYCIREKRVGASITRSSVRQGERSKAVLAEYAVVVRKR